MNNFSKLHSTLKKKTDKFIWSISSSSNDIARIIRYLDPNKANGHDMITICMLKICGESISKPLEKIFKSCIGKVQFPNEWKKANVFPVHEKGDKQVSRNYRPVSWLPVCGKTFERLICNNLFEFFIKNDHYHLINQVLSKVTMYQSDFLYYIWNLSIVWQRFWS